jgi:hypothetical protein
VIFARPATKVSTIAAARLGPIPQPSGLAFSRPDSAPRQGPGLADWHARPETIDTCHRIGTSNPARDHGFMSYRCVNRASVAVCPGGDRDTMSSVTQIRAGLGWTCLTSTAQRPAFCRHGKEAQGDWAQQARRHAASSGRCDRIRGWVHVRVLFGLTNSRSAAWELEQGRASRCEACPSRVSW